MLREQRGLEPPIAEVARTCGFADGRSLRRAFLEIYDAAPSTVREARPEGADIWAKHAVAISALFDRT